MTAVLALLVVAAGLSAPLQLQLDPPRFEQAISRSGFTEFTKPTGPQAVIEITSTDGFPVPLRGRCWTVAGGYGLATVFASMAGILAEAFTRSTTANSDARNKSITAVAMGVGALAGIVPGALLGNESRREEMGLGRGVVSLLDVGGSVALFFTVNQVFATQKFF